MSTLDQVVAAIRGHRFRYTSEDELQEGIAAAISQTTDLQVLREVRLSDRDRIDIFVGGPMGVGIEVKVAGSQTHPWGQLKRYAEHDQIDALILVTSRVYQLPDEVLGKHLETVSLAGMGL